MILFSVLMLSAQVAAAPAAPAIPVQATEPTKAKEKKICKTDPESDPGSHMVKRICHTQSEWNQQGVLGSSRSGFSVSGDKMEGH